MQEVEREICVFVPEWQLKILEEVIESGKISVLHQQYNKLFRQASSMDSETTG